MPADIIQQALDVLLIFGYNVIIFFKFSGLCFANKLCFNFLVP